MLLGRFPRRFDGQKKTALTVVVLAFLAAAFVLPLTAWAATPDLGLGFGTATGLTTVDVRTLIGNIIKGFLGLLGIIAVVLILYAGFVWMTAGGSEEKVTKAKQILINATIGLIIILSSYAIASFILGALNNDGTGGGGGGGGGPQSPGFFIGSGSGALGSGIIDYHYPEPGQTGVPRNTKIAISFKRPLVLSTVLQGYVDQAGPTIGPLPDTQQFLNSDNIKLIANTDLKTGTGTGTDAKFTTRYADAIAGTVLKAAVTVIADPKLGTQTLVITPNDPIGSPTQDMNYRVALRGGPLRANDTGTPTVDESLLGIQVWEPKADGTGFDKKPAFDDMDADGGYFWTFTTNTTIDVTPPQIVSVVPVAGPVNSNCESDSSCVFRNQILQVYFDEAVDPTTASGIIPGFNNIDIQAKCRAGLDCLPAYTNPGPVAGTMAIGNRYRTAEFLPSTLCEDVAENSCGEPVFCLPKNVTLTILIKAAEVDPKNPPQSLVTNGIVNGIVDMVGNSLDGNGNGKADGPAPAGQEYPLNAHPAPGTLKDTASVTYVVGDAVDLVPPKVTAVDPPSKMGLEQSQTYKLECKGGTSPGAPCTLDETCAGGGQCKPQDPQTGGPSNVPTDLPIRVTWSKNMMVSSIRTGKSTDTSATVTLDASECRKKTCTKVDPKSCTCESLNPPDFFVESEPVSGHTEMTIKHRAFFTANDLGFTEEESVLPTLPKPAIPKYVPALHAKLKDDKQNCFFPSEFTGCVGMDDQTQTSCCNKAAQSGYDCKTL